MHPFIERVYGASPAYLQSALITAYGVRIRLQRFDRRYEAWTRFLGRSERFSAEELRAYQDERLREAVRHAYEKVPYYRAVFRERGLTPHDVRTQEDLSKLPILTKEILRRRSRELIAEGLEPRRLKASPTSGTTGSPLTVYWDREADVLWNVMIWRHREWAGVRFGDRYGTLLGRMVVPPGRAHPPFWRRNLAWNQVLYSSFHLAPANMPLYAEALRRSGIVALEAYPSTAYILACGLEEAGARLGLKAVFTSSEPLLAMQRERIEDQFGGPVFDYYGMSEAIMFAGECPAHAGLHHHAEMSVVEVLDADGSPARDGQVGRLVGTTLHNRAMPLLRYDIGDLTARSGAACPCGRAHPLFSPVTTKAEDILVAPDGRLISPSVITHPLKPLKGLVRSQFVQEAIDRLRVRLVLDAAPPPDLLDRLRDGLAARIGSGIRIEIEVVDEIPVGPSGKFRWVISRVPLQDKLLAGGNLFTRAEDVRPAAPAPP
jgi:phenylacetate-CoA ligase